ncbi:hypothetical protein OG978_02215 [Streptomyces sp. NBC_01591]|uniref:hypothetical protein n=1 Tax=Streptomyces sp. NBC_01591 TaxID=2975888 RepID=UPI002DDBFD4C|nr:hypothetical protein [Streptomyces sp. NBC_01591]WSD66329.1 hypothetical protein OG978_02215 [Streptomyces sp. NBC_01591]
MSYSIFLLRFMAGEAVALDAERFRQVTEPYVVAGGPGEGFSQLRAEDGGEADLYHASQDEDVMLCVTATHFARGAMSGVLARLAAALRASIVPQDGGALIFHEEERRHLPADLRGKAVVIVPTADAFQAAFDAL